MNLRDYKSVLERRKAVESELGISLANSGSFSLDESVVVQQNCENMIGVTQVPLGVAGPLRTSLQSSAVSHQTKEYYVPLATTEGALVASVNRGCKAITESGRATVVVELMGTTRGAVFKTGSLEQSLDIKRRLLDSKSQIKQIAEGTSRHLLFLDLSVTVVGVYVFVRFSFDTKAAMGMNMVTIAAKAIVNWVEKETKVQCLSIAGNNDVDKKPSWLNALLGRGRRVQAETVISEKTVVNILKTTPQKIYDTWLAKCMIGSAVSGTMGFNAHFANIVAALFLATGQDVAHVAESSCGFTVALLDPRGLRISVTLPDVMVGAWGGGTGLATQKEALAILGITKRRSRTDVDQLASVVGAAVLAGELSLLASLAEGTLAEAHEKLGRSGKRNKPAIQ